MMEGMLIYELIIYLICTHFLVLMNIFYYYALNMMDINQNVIDPLALYLIVKFLKYFSLLLFLFLLKLSIKIFFYISYRQILLSR
jgi:hypothetical protein